MGVIQHKPIQQLIEEKYRLAREKNTSQRYQLCVWRYTIQELSKQLFKFRDSVNYCKNSDEQQFCKGECIDYPFKMFTDEGYICAILQNKQNKSFVKGSQCFNPTKQKQKCVPLQILQLLYLVSLNSFHSYYTTSLQFETYSVHFQIICGDLMESIQKLKLLSILSQLEKYLRLGSENIIKKIFNQPSKISKVNICYQNELENIQSLEQRERMIDIGRLVTKRLQTNVSKVYDQLIRKLFKFKVFKVFIFGINPHSSYQLEDSCEKKTNYKKCRKSMVQNLKNFDHNSQNQNFIVAEDHVLEQKKHQVSHIHKPTHLNQILGDQFEEYQNIIGNQQKQYIDLDVSSPFLCEITQIQQNNRIPQIQRNKTQRNRITENQRHIQMGGDIDESLFLPKQLQNLKIDRNLYHLKIPKSFNQAQGLEPQIILSTYPGSSVYSNLIANNICLMVNLTPQQAYNYFVNDVNYQWYFLRNFKPEQIGQTSIDKIKNIQLFNIESLIFKFVNTIQSSLAKANQKIGIQKSKKVGIFCNSTNFIYSGAFAIGYLIVKNQFRFTFQQALQVVMTSTNNKFYLSRIYQLQLRDIHSRIQAMSSISNINSLNTKSSLFRLYAVTPYNQLTPYHLVCKYMGQISNSNQIQSINYSNKAVFMLIPTNISSILIKIVNLMRQDGQNAKLQNVKKNMKSMGLIIKLMCGKQTEQRTSHLEYAMKQLLLIVKYEFINFSKKIFNVQKYKIKIQTVLQCLQVAASVQNIEKTFRKPQPFTPLIFAQLNPNLLVLKSSSFKQKLPYNSKQTIIFKYPILRPIFQAKRKDGYYILLKVTQNGEGCHVKMHKGVDWIGLQQDKQSYFQRIIQSYIRDISQDKIWIEDNDQAEVSLFDDNSIGF